MADVGAEIRLTIENEAGLTNLRKLGEWIDSLEESCFSDSIDTNYARMLLQEVVGALDVSALNGKPLWPKPGQRFVWEMDKPHAACGVQVIEFQEHPDGDVWVTTQSLQDPSQQACNTLRRFIEACRPYVDLIGPENIPTC